MQAPRPNAQGRQRRPVPDARDLQREAVLLLGGLRAVLLQLAHPAVGHGVARHSGFAQDPTARLAGTLAYVYVVADGDPDLVRRMSGRVGRMHAAVRSGADASPAYDARDAGLQFWVTATLHDTAVRIAEAVWGPLPATVETDLLALGGRIGTVLGMPPERWPTSVDAFDRATADAERDLAFDDVTLAVVRDLFQARRATLPLRLAMPFLVAGTLPTLPARLRAQLEPVVPRRAPDLLPALRRLAPLYRALPIRIRHRPSRLVVAAARRYFERHPRGLGTGADGVAPAA